MPLLLSRSDMKTLLRMDDVITVIENGFRNSGQRDDRIPVRLALEVPDRAAVTLFMPAYLSGSSTLGAKIVSVFPQNPTAGLPVITGFYILCDAESGALLALMDATYLTGIRTAAASAVATERLARRDAAVLGIVGAGVQARFHLEAMKAVRPIREVIVYNRTRERGIAFVEEMAAIHGLPVRLTGDANECLQADIVVTCTRSPVPMFDGRRVRPGAHFNAVGVYTPDSQELDDHIICHASLYVDTFEGALAEAGDLLIPMRKGLITRDHILGDLAGLIRGSVPGRRTDDEITVFKSVGFALEDAVAAKMAYQSALARNLGASFEL